VPTDAASWRLSEDEEIVPGRYAKRLLGGGTRYEAYLAWDEELFSLVVAKVLRPSHAALDYAIEGLAAEAAVLARLSHPSLLRSFDVVLDGERPHLTLEFLEGPRLSTLLRKHGALSLEQLVPLGVQVCSVLHYMERRGFVHLDVKPKNIIMGAPPRLIDLSVARTVEDAGRITTQIGTDAYMAPEQCEPERGRIGPPADVWGIGVTLFEAASGYHPFPRTEDADDRYPQVRFDPLPMPEDLPPQLIETVRACLEKNPGARPRAGETANALEPVLAALPTRPRLGRFKPR
jgi:eukaryotic-like serine/threonine-protein kinase